MNVISPHVKSASGRHMEILYFVRHQPLPCQTLCQNSYEGKVPVFSTAMWEPNQP